MCIGAGEVRTCSMTGAFDALADAKINLAIELVCPLYAGLAAANVDNNWRKLVALHAAHILHDALKSEGVDGQDGPVASESFAQVGSRSYAIAQQLPDGENWWQSSPYGRLLHRYWVAMPPALRAVG